MKETNVIATTPAGDDARADRATFVWVAGFFLAFLIVDILSSMTEVARFRLDVDPAKVAIYEISSVFVILVLYWGIARAVSLALRRPRPRGGDPHILGGAYQRDGRDQEARLSGDLRLSIYFHRQPGA